MRMMPSHRPSVPCPPPPPKRRQPPLPPPPPPRRQEEAQEVDEIAGAKGHGEPELQDDAEEQEGLEDVSRLILGEQRAEEEAAAVSQAYEEWVEYATRRVREMRQSHCLSFDAEELKSFEAIAVPLAGAIADAEPHADEPRAVEAHAEPTIIIDGVHAVDPHAWRVLMNEYEGFHTLGARRMAWAIMEEDRRHRLEAAAAGVLLRWASTEAEQREAILSLEAESARLRKDAALSRAEVALAELWQWGGFPDQ